ncbi:MAG: hypothetical protein COB20_09915 [SAR86 cluster bacterium]|uniref:ABC transporter permease n=1 Tax=SAR86 cluster bacterium TaxID=2030880 RepID=A0A2A4X370_9GAMM|nr:MAG: hypothetical protein COB20_09915 [SAR86 cluster bacterium]
MLQLEGRIIVNLPLDIQHNLRSLRKDFGFVGLCVLVIGLGMAVSVTMYSFITGSVYTPMPFPDGDRYVAIQRIDPETRQVELSPTTDSYTYQVLRDAVQSYKSFGAWRDSYAVVSDGDVAEQFFAAHITPSLLQITAVEPLFGRNLLPSDDVPGADPVVLISYKVWQNYYDGREGVVGTISRINGNPHTIVGVMPENFVYPVSNELWLPLQLPTSLQPGDKPVVRLMGVLADDASIDSAAAEVNSLMLQLGEREPEFYLSAGATATFFSRHIAPSIIFYHMLTALTVALLLLVCLNVTNLFVVRANERVNELAIRSALGATPWRIVQTILLDSLLICMLGSLLGFILADFCISYVESMNSGIFERITLTSSPVWSSWSDSEWEFGNYIVALLVVLVIWLFSGGLAAWKVFRQDISTVLAAGSTGAVGSTKSAGNVVLVSVEIVFSCFLLILCGVLVGAANDLADVDYGTASVGYLTGRVNLPTVAYPDVNSRESYRQNLRQNLLGKDGISEVTFTSALPSQHGALTNYNLEGRNLLSDNNGYPAQESILVAEDYFDVLEVPLREGRTFDSSDNVDSLPVVIIDELFAAQVWPDQSALGKRIEVHPGTESAQWLTVVGVTSHIIQRWSLLGVSEFSLYRPFLQDAPSSNVPSQNSGEIFSVAIEVEGKSNSYRQILREAGAGVDRDIPITFIAPLSEVLEMTNAMTTISNTISSNIAFFTLVLAVTGIYALVSRSVWQRSREIGIRRALGSSDAKVLWVFVRQALKYLSLGLFLGGGAAVLASSSLTILFTGIMSWLPIVFACVSVGFGLLVFVAAYNPARRLISLEPGEALHYE